MRLQTIIAIAIALNSAVLAADPAPAPAPAPAKPEAAAKKEGLFAAAADGMVNDFLVLSGIPFVLNPGGAASREANVSFVNGELTWRPREGNAFRSDKILATKPLRWQHVQRGAADIALRSCGGAPQSVSYAFTCLIMPDDGEATVEMGSTKPAWLIVNGQWAHNGALKLQKGVNSVLIRMHDDDGAGAFSLRVLAKDRKPLPDLRVAISVDAEEDEKRSRSMIEPDPAFVLFPKSQERISYALELMTPKTVQMKDKAIDFLLRSQQANGAWSDTNYPESVGVTALACLALLAEGSLPRQGPHGKALNKGLEFLLASFHDEGVFASKSVEGYGVMYGHALTTLVLLETGGNLPWRTDVEDKISKALQVFTRNQHNDGGWRYELSITGDSDISVTTTVLWVLGQARKSGYYVPRETMDRALQFVERCGQADGRFMYRLNGVAKVEPHSGVGVAALYGAGRIDNPLLAPARDLIAREYQRYSVQDLVERRHLLFGSFFASLAMYSSGYDYWKAWYLKMTQVFEKLQSPDGDLPDEEQNKVYTTALAAIMLQAPLGYLSIYQQ